MSVLLRCSVAFSLCFALLALHFEGPFSPYLSVPQQGDILRVHSETYDANSSQRSHSNSNTSFPRPPGPIHSCLITTPYTDNPINSHTSHLPCLMEAHPAVPFHISPQHGVPHLIYHQTHTFPPTLTPNSLLSSPPPHLSSPLLSLLSLPPPLSLSLSLLSSPLLSSPLLSSPLLSSPCLSSPLLSSRLLSSPLLSSPPSLSLPPSPFSSSSLFSPLLSLSSSPLLSSSSPLLSSLYLSLFPCSSLPSTTPPSSLV